MSCLGMDPTNQVPSGLEFVGDAVGETAHGPDAIRACGSGHDDLDPTDNSCRPHQRRRGRGRPGRPWPATVHARDEVRTCSRCGLGSNLSRKDPSTPVQSLSNPSGNEEGRRSWVRPSDLRRLAHQRPAFRQGPSRFPKSVQSLRAGTSKPAAPTRRWDFPRRSTPGH